MADNITLNEFIEKLIKLQEEGYGNKQLVFDDFYCVSEVEYDENLNKIVIF